VALCKSYWRSGDFWLGGGLLIGPSINYLLKYPEIQEVVAGLFSCLKLSWPKGQLGVVAFLVAAKVFINSLSSCLSNSAALPQYLKPTVGSTSFSSKIIAAKQIWSIFDSSQIFFISVIASSSSFLTINGVYYRPFQVISQCNLHVLFSSSLFD
jgi:hypothetical protein